MNRSVQRWLGLGLSWAVMSVASAAPFLESSVTWQEYINGARTVDKSIYQPDLLPVTSNSATFGGSTAQTGFGVNRGSVFTSLTKPGLNLDGTYGEALSRWTDSFVVTGGSGQALLTAVTAIDGELTTGALGLSSMIVTTGVKNAARAFFTATSTLAIQNTQYGVQLTTLGGGGSADVRFEDAGQTYLPNLSSGPIALADGVFDHDAFLITQFLVPYDVAFDFQTGVGLSATGGGSAPRAGSCMPTGLPSAFWRLEMSCACDSGGSV